MENTRIAYFGVYMLEFKIHIKEVEPHIFAAYAHETKYDFKYENNCILTTGTAADMVKFFMDPKNDIRVFLINEGKGIRVCVVPNIDITFGLTSPITFELSEVKPSSDKITLDNVISMSNPDYGESKDNFEYLVQQYNKLRYTMSEK